MARSPATEGEDLRARFPADFLPCCKELLSLCWATLLGREGWEAERSRTSWVSRPTGSPWMLLCFTSCCGCIRREMWEPVARDRL